MEINFSARKFEECSGFLAKDNVVLIEGRLDARDDELRSVLLRSPCSRWTTAIPSCDWPTS